MWGGAGARGGHRGWAKSSAESFALEGAKPGPFVTAPEPRGESAPLYTRRPSFDEAVLKDALLVLVHVRRPRIHPVPVSLSRSGGLPGGARFANKLSRVRNSRTEAGRSTRENHEPVTVPVSPRHGSPCFLERIPAVGSSDARPGAVPGMKSFR